MYKEIINKIHYTYSKTGVEYISVHIDTDEIKEYLDLLRIYLDDKKYKKYMNNQSIRDTNSYHLTIFTTKEYKCIDKIKLESYMGKLVQVKLLGIGRGNKKDLETYFIVAECSKINELRNIFGFDNRDLHITLGFKSKDIYNIPKNKNTIII